MSKYNGNNLTKQKGLTTRAKWGISIFAVSFVLFFFSVTTFVKPLYEFLLGAFGVALYPILVALMGTGILLMLKKQYYIAKFYLFVVIAMYFVVVLFFQVVLTSFVNANSGNYLTFEKYIANCYTLHNTPGGVVCGVFAYLMFLGLDKIGSILLLAIAFVLCVAFIIDHFLKIKEYKSLSEQVVSFPFRFGKKKTERDDKSDKKVVKIKKNTKQQNIYEQSKVSEKKEQEEKKEETKITLNAFQQMQENSKNKFFDKLESYQNNDDDRIAKNLFGEDFINSVQQSSKQQEKAKNFTLSELYEDKKESEQQNWVTSRNDEGPSRFVHVDEEAFCEELDDDLLKFDDNLKDGSQNRNSFENETFNGSNDDFSYDITKKEENKSFEDDDINFSDMEDIIAPKEEAEEEVEDIEKNLEERTFKPEIKEEPVFNIPKSFFKQPEKDEEKIEEKQQPPMRVHYKAYKRPSLDLLTTKSTQIQENEDVFQEKAVILEETLDSFKIPAKVMGITCGPAVTRYELQMPIGIPVKRITQHAEDIQMRMESRGGVRIETPIPGRSLVGVEIPNSKIATIGLKDILESSQFVQSKGALTFALGKDIGGDCKVCNLEAMPHLLVAGSTGSGKSVCLNVLLISLLYKLGPDELKLILIDPKRVEFVTYNGLPHMLVPKAINDAREAINALDWVTKEMMRRYDVFSQKRVRNFKEYNAMREVLSGEEEKLPYIVVVIDELADLMILDAGDLEKKIQRLTQLARAAGIHLIIATQRPSVDVITGVIKSNLPSRIAFAVTDFASSKTILDKGGAEKLLGKGDMLYAPQDLPEPIRIQCPFVDSKEVFEITEYIRQNNEAYFDDEIAAFISRKESSTSQETNTNSTSRMNDEWDELLPQVLLDCIQAKGASVSMVQRKYRVGFSRAGRIIDQMQTAGFIGERDPGKQTRNVLITLEQYKEIFEKEEN